MRYHYLLWRTPARVRLDRGPLLPELANLLRTLSPRNKVKVCRQNKTQLTDIQNKFKAVKKG